jgi:bifunctional enzyme CysN/CysC
MGEEEGLVGRVYDLQLLTQRAAVSITRIKHRLNIENLTHEAAQTLRLNDICECALASNKPIVFDAFDRSKPLGAFILIDRFSHATVAAGMIRHSLRRAENVHQQDLAVKREDREKLSGHPAKVVWFTGLSGSGKSATANALEIALHASGCRTFILDGDNVRQGLNKDLGFTDADRVENIRRVAEVAKLMFDAGLVVMAAFISPFRHEREMVREMIGAQNFIEVYVNTPLEVCEQRDAKGLYKKARQGKIPNFSGIGSAYEAPENPDIILDCASLSPSDAAAKILGLIETRRAAKNPSEPEKN